jgi:DNA/RNA-binding domain of Phe-tRNA-synthetase-like protein
MQLLVDAQVQQLLPGAIFGVVEAQQVSVVAHHAALTTILDELSERLHVEYGGKTAADRREIAATRRAYRALGDDPTHYRPANEALLRRVLSRRALPPINSVVDVNNIVSLESGFALGCYNVAQIVGSVVVRRGVEGEEYAPIGKPPVDATNRLVLVDDHGIFGSPTADSQRTMVTSDVDHVLFVIFAFDASVQSVHAAQKRVATLLTQFCGATIIDQTLVTSG